MSFYHVDREFSLQRVTSGRIKDGIKPTSSAWATVGFGQTIEAVGFANPEGMTSVRWNNENYMAYQHDIDKKCTLVREP